MMTEEQLKQKIERVEALLEKSLEAVESDYRNGYGVEAKANDSKTLHHIAAARESLISELRHTKQSTNPAL